MGYGKVKWIKWCNYYIKNKNEKVIYPRRRLKIISLLLKETRSQCSTSKRTFEGVNFNKIDEDLHFENRYIKIIKESNKTMYKKLNKYN